jgi:hypothetical protein
MNATPTHPLPDEPDAGIALARFPHGYGLMPMVFLDGPGGTKIAALRYFAGPPDTTHGAYPTVADAHAALVPVARSMVAARLREYRRDGRAMPKRPTLRERAASGGR